jgi:hypothetical protein
MKRFYDSASLPIRHDFKLKPLYDYITAEDAGEPVEAYEEDGTAWLQEDGTQVYQEG